MRTLTTLLMVLLAALIAGFAQTAELATPAPIAAAPAPGAPLVAADRLQIRDIQLAMAQAHIARLQAEAQVKNLETQLGQTIESLKTVYSCQGCTLQTDFTWMKPEPPKTPAPPAPSPAPKKGGQTSNKE